MSFQFPLRPRAEFLCETRGLLAIFAKCHKVSCLRIDIFDKADKACCIPGTETGGLHRVLFFYPLKLAKRLSQAALLAKLLGLAGNPASGRMHWMH